MGTKERIVLNTHYLARLTSHTAHIRLIHTRTKLFKTISRAHHTAFRQRIAVAHIVVPRDDTHKVGDKRRNRALENCRVATNHVLVVHLRLIELRDHCGTNMCSFSYIVVLHIPRRIKKKD